VKTRILFSLLFLTYTVCTVAAADIYTERRLAMVAADIKGRGIADRKVLEVMAAVPRHLFVEEGQRDAAYADHPLPIGEGQTISQPYVVALMTEVLRLKPTDRVLEIGTGSGYQAAVLAGIVKEVYTIEIRQVLAERATKRLKDLGYRNVKVAYGDGYYGWKEYAPFDAIIITAFANHVPPLEAAQGRRKAGPAFGKHLLLPDPHPVDQEKGSNGSSADHSCFICPDDRRSPEEKIRKADR